MCESMIIKATSVGGIFILTQPDSYFKEMVVKLIFSDFTPIVTVRYPFSAYRYSPHCNYQISKRFDPVSMKKCADEFLKTIKEMDEEIDTKDLKEELRSFECQA